MEVLTQMMNGVIRQFQFARQTCGGFPFTDPAQQENDLDRAQVLVGKERIGIDRINGLTVPTAIPRQMIAFRLTEEARAAYTDTTSRTMQPCGMKIFCQPLLAQRIVANLKKWKVHAKSVPSYSKLVKRLHIV